MIPSMCLELELDHFSPAFVWGNKVSHGVTGALVNMIFQTSFQMLFCVKLHPRILQSSDNHMSKEKMCVFYRLYKWLYYPWL